MGNITIPIRKQKNSETPGETSLTRKDGRKEHWWLPEDDVQRANKCEGNSPLLTIKEMQIQTSLRDSYPDKHSNYQEDWRDGSIGRDDCCHDWCPKFDSRLPYSKGRRLIHTNCPLTCTCEHIYTHMYTHCTHIGEDVKGKKTLINCYGNLNEFTHYGNHHGGAPKSKMKANVWFSMHSGVCMEQIESTHHRVACTLMVSVSHVSSLTWLTVSKRRSQPTNILRE